MAGYTSLSGKQTITIRSKCPGCGKIKFLKGEISPKEVFCNLEHIEEWNIKLRGRVPYDLHVFMSPKRSYSAIPDFLANALQRI